MGLGKGEGSGGSHPSPDEKVGLGDPNLWWTSTRSLAGAVMGTHNSIQGGRKSTGFKTMGHIICNSGVSSTKFTLGPFTSSKTNHPTRRIRPYKTSQCYSASTG